MGLAIDLIELGGNQNAEKNGGKEKPAVAKRREKAAPASISSHVTTNPCQKWQTNPFTAASS
ncbi:MULTISPECIES: hypothetical protein [unclassified Agrobacterium]